MTKPRVTLDPFVMGGRACIRVMQPTVGTIVGLVASGKSFHEILATYPHLERDDLIEAMKYAAGRASARDLGSLDRAR